MKVNIDKYVLAVVVISVVVAFLTHFPELISLFDHSGQNSLFSGMSMADVANEIFFTFVSLLILFAMNTVLFGFNRPTARITWGKMILSFVLTGFASNLMGQGFVFLHHQFDIPAIDAMVHHYLHPLRDFIITCIVTGSCYMIHLIRKSQLVSVENEQLRSENLVNQFEALKNQLNPHMLFNSLNTLRSLIRETPDNAQDYLQELSRVLRYTLQGNECMSVTLREEMEFVNAYNFLLKMRYEENLEFDIRIEEEAETLQLPPMSVQLLIENAVKHNEISNRHPLVIRVCTTGKQLTVSNPIQRKKTASGGLQIGLANLAKRYSLLFKEEIEVREDNNTFIVTIPLI
ncbi:histidine kinase [Parabacteroides faecis]|uniref:sensor histidine kinase n=1 Tax=Parabacteroides TaxID=375288 RepID=UPI000F003523|nr:MULTISPECIES: histidine kinase [Parabacteroides]MBC8619652.1 histidine kinase [Parabacteroides faecis]RHR95367.1 histidine kinase [Parabacteroides sp. AF14-59]